MALTSLAVENAKPKKKRYTLADGNGLHLLVTTTGGKLWRLRYRFGAKANMLSFGSFPAVSLASARAKRDGARKLLAAGSDPSRQKKLDKIAAANEAKNTFGAIAEEHLGNLVDSGTAESTMTKNRWYLQTLAAPLTHLPITEITSAEILGLLKKIEKSGRRETARKVRGAIGSVFRLAISTLRATNDPTYPLRRALLKPIVQHRPAITDEPKLGALMLAIDE
ncbi:MAG: Arm DNA-binding domain-containing protein, partial [Xanthobacteraceae bacterium]